MRPLQRIYFLFVIYLCTKQAEFQNKADDSMYGETGNSKHELELVNKEGITEPSNPHEHLRVSVSNILGKDSTLKKKIDTMDSDIGNLMNKISKMKRKITLNNLEKSREEIHQLEDTDEDIEKNRVQLFKKLLGKKVLSHITRDIYKKKFFNFVRDYKAERMEIPEEVRARLERKKGKTPERGEKGTPTSEEHETEETSDLTYTEVQYLTNEEEATLEKRVFEMSNKEVSKKFFFILRKQNLLLPKYFELSSYKSAFNGLVLTRFLFKKSNSQKFLHNLLKSFFYCKISLTKDSSGYARVIKVSKILTKSAGKFANSDQATLAELKSQSYQYLKDNSHKNFGFTFDLYQRFNRDINAFTEFIENLKFFFGQVLTEGGMATSRDAMDPVDQVMFTGMRLERVIKKNFSRFNAIKDHLAEYVEQVYRGVFRIDCDVRDMMAFYRLLPRFHLVYSKIHDRLVELRDPVIEYYKEKIVELLFHWQQHTQKVLEVFNIIMLWTIQAKFIFELPGTFSQNLRFKYTMIVRSVETWLDITTVAQNFQMTSDLILDSYLAQYQELRDVFAGLEDYINLKIPFDIPVIKKDSVWLQGFGIICMMLLLLLQFP